MFDSTVFGLFKFNHQLDMIGSIVQIQIALPSAIEVQNKKVHQIHDAATISRQKRFSSYP
jgi:hypothetical protein